MQRPLEPDEAQAFLDYMVELGLMEKLPGPGGRVCYSLAAPLEPQHPQVRR